MYRRFLDDKEITDSQKRWTISLLRKTSFTVANEDFTWGLPEASGLNNDSGEVSGQDSLAWMQGWSPAGSDQMIRSSTGIYGSDVRFIVVSIGRYSEGTSNQEADRVITDVSKAIINGTDSSESKGGSLGSMDNGDEGLKQFQDSQRKIFG